jgi:ABC-type bacteriocin transporter
MKKSVKVRQQDITDCGVACLASVAGWYGLQYPMARIRQFASTDRKGTNVLGMIEAAEKLGLLAKGVRGGHDAVNSIPLPAIAHLKLPGGLLHFVVVYGISRTRIEYMDPADGKMHRKNRDKFLAAWTGILILVSPMPHFGKGILKIPMRKRILQVIRPASGLILQALAGAFTFSILGLATSVYVQKIIDHILPGQNTNLLNLLSIIMIILLFFRIFIGGSKSLLLMKAGQYIDGALILGYYRHLLSLPQRFFDTMRTGEIISRINDAVKIRHFISEVSIELVVNVFIIACTLFCCLFISLKAAAILLLIIPGYAVIYFVFNAFNKKILRKIMERSADLESQLVESIQGMRTIKTLSLREFANSRTEASFIELLRAGFRGGKFSIRANYLAGFISGLTTILLLWTGSYQVINLELTPGELMMIYTLFGYMLGPVNSLISMNKTIQDASIAADRLFQIIDLEVEKMHDQSVDIKKHEIRTISFQKVSFRYGSHTNIFDELTLSMKAGSIYGIVGESGCGKSTIVSMLMKLYPVRSGKILINQVGLEHIQTRSLREAIGLVPQQIDNFAGSILENIAPGDNEPDVYRILNLCEQSGLRCLIDRLPDGINTMIGEYGIHLSGGENQKLALVRALYKNPGVLILDEATSSLDARSESHFTKIFDQLKKEVKTIIIIAHRLYTIKSADRIFCIHDGKVVEQGGHDELLNKKGFYFDLWKKQTG